MSASADASAVVHCPTTTTTSAGSPPSSNPHGAAAAAAAAACTPPQSPRMQPHPQSLPPSPPRPPLCGPAVSTSSSSNTNRNPNPHFFSAYAPTPSVAPALVIGPFDRREATAIDVVVELSNDRNPSPPSTASMPPPSCWVKLAELPLRYDKRPEYFRPDIPTELQGLISTTLYARRIQHLNHHLSRLFSVRDHAPLLRLLTLLTTLTTASLTLLLLTQRETTSRGLAGMTALAASLSLALLFCGGNPLSIEAGARGAREVVNEAVVRWSREDRSRRGLVWRSVRDGVTVGGNGGGNAYAAAGSAPSGGGSVDCAPARSGLAASLSPSTAERSIALPQHPGSVAVGRPSIRSRLAARWGLWPASPQWSLVVEGWAGDGGTRCVPPVADIDEVDPLPLYTPSAAGAARESRSTPASPVDSGEESEVDDDSDDESGGGGGGRRTKNDSGPLHIHIEMTRIGTGDGHDGHDGSFGNSCSIDTGWMTSSSSSSSLPSSSWSPTAAGPGHVVGLLAPPSLLSPRSWGSRGSAGGASSVHRPISSTSSSRSPSWSAVARSAAGRSHAGGDDDDNDAPPPPPLYEA
ncbi:hypothetical protein DFJ73DRAFT_940691 [Zopfochytrium polystomum]|nr:hypothetical protein DFJ73DRAFT_940691 [Zopfochytrium polystomum]